MLANVYSAKNLIGQADLQPGDITMGGVYGQFIPNEHYFSGVREVVQLFNSDRKKGYTQWQELQLNVQLENGYFLHPLGGYTFDDLEELPEGPVSLEIAGVDTRIIEDFILAVPSRPFIEEPWETLNINQKIAFERQLKKEVAPAHILAGIECSALCKEGGSDDVLFAVNGMDDKSYALVHLTWTNNLDNEGRYPQVILYESYDDFKLNRMYPDKEEWES